MLRVKSLIEDSRKTEGFKIGISVVRSTFETTNNHMTPGNRKVDNSTVIFKITSPHKSSEITIDLRGAFNV